MPRDEELIVITKAYDLILWSCNHTRRFFRNHRFVLGDRMERNLFWNCPKKLAGAELMSSSEFR